MVSYAVDVIALKQHIFDEKKRGPSRLTRTCDNGAGHPFQKSKGVLGLQRQISHVAVGNVSTVCSKESNSFVMTMLINWWDSPKGHEHSEFNGGKLCVGASAKLGAGMTTPELSVVTQSIRFCSIGIKFRITVVVFNTNCRIGDHDWCE